VIPSGYVKIAIENCPFIVDLPIFWMVIFHSYVTVYQAGYIQLESFVNFSEQSGSYFDGVAGSVGSAVIMTRSSLGRNHWDDLPEFMVRTLRFIIS
jgi:hypothetical protein